jgi:hypothetical protein
MRYTVFLCTLLFFGCTTADFPEPSSITEEEEPITEVPDPEEENYPILLECPVPHEKSDVQEPFQRRWKLVGIIQDGEDEIVYPPCIGYFLYRPGFHYPYMIFLEFTAQLYGNERPNCSDCLAFIGFGGVNRIFGYYQFDDKDNSISIHAGTKFAGNHIDLRNFEKIYKINISNTKSFTLEGNELHLYYEGGKMLYTPTDEVPSGVY